MKKTEFKNMKIAITDEVHLKAVCEVLESMGYEQDDITYDKVITVCTWSLSRTYDCYNMDLVCHYHDEIVTLTDLLKMRDDMVRDGVIKLRLMGIRFLLMRMKLYIAQNPKKMFMIILLIIMARQRFAKIKQRASLSNVLRR